MNKVEINIYEIGELSEKASEIAYHDWLNTCDYPFSDDYNTTLDIFCDVFGFKVTDYRCDYRYIKFYSLHDEEINELSGVRLLKYLYNNYFDDLFHKKIYYFNYSRKKRTSNIHYNSECPFTGCFVDNDILDPIYKFLKKPDENTTFYNLIEECLYSWIDSYNIDYDYHTSFEYFKEECENNSIMFYSDGSEFNEVEYKVV